MNFSPEKIPSNEIAITFPMNPRHWNKIGFSGIFAYLKSLSYSKGLESVGLFNIVEKENEDDVNRMVDRLQSLGLLPDRIMKDSNIDQHLVSNVFNLLYREGIVKLVNESIVRCSC